jgi:queuine tRNA-ribosyltransferase
MSDQSKNFGFTITSKLPGSLGRAGVIHTPHGDINTPAFIVVGTKATVKALTPHDVRMTGAQAVLANTYHLYLEPGSDLVRDAGGLHSFMNWEGPIFTDSGGFQVFSLGAAFGKGVSKVASGNEEISGDGRATGSVHAKPALVDDDGVTFTSHLDGSTHRFTPERSMEIQHDLGADIIVAFDECTSPHDPHDIQERSLARTHEWAARSLSRHRELGGSQALYGVVQGGKYQDLREHSARTLGGMDFDGFGIGGSFNKDDIGTAVAWVNTLLPEGKPRHLLGIGEPIDLFLGVENGIDTFDCVSPTRIGRNGALYTQMGRININNAQYVRDFGPIENECTCYTCMNFTRAYLAHLFRSDEMLGATLASIHNIHFIVSLVEKMRRALLEGNFLDLKTRFLSSYYHA